MKLLEEAHFPALRRIVGQIDSRADAIDEVLQRTRERLFVAPPAKISSYRGEGSLAAWLRVVAGNAARDYVREKWTTRGLLPPEICVYSDASAQHELPEAAFLDQHQGRLLRVALSKAIGALKPEERRLLYMHFIDELTIDELGAILTVHRSTVARRVQRLLAGVRQRVLREVPTDLGVLQRGCQDVLATLLDDWDWS